MPDTRVHDVAAPERSMTPREFGHTYRMSKDRVLDLIRRGELGALNLAMVRAGRPRYVITPSHVAAFEAARQVATQPKASRRRKKAPGMVDYYPNGSDA